MKDELDIPRSKRVFHLSRPDQLFKKLYWEVDNVHDSIRNQAHENLNHEVAAYHAFNTAVTAWHLTDWTWNSLPEDSQRRLASDLAFELTSSLTENLKSFQRAFRKQSSSLEICWDIANGSKHLDSHKNSKIDAKVKWDSKVATAGEFRAGQPLQTFSYDFVVHWQNQSYRIVDVLEDVRTFWMGQLHKLGFLGDVFAKIEITVKKTSF